MLMDYKSTLRVLASHKVNPLTVPSVNLHNILVKVKHDMKTNPRLVLPDDPDRNIWAYLQTHEIKPLWSWMTYY